jgi:hypothetical protein
MGKPGSSGREIKPIAAKGTGKSMALEQKIALFFGMDDATWLRHANPWSVISRNTVLPALVISLWTRIWLGWWAIVPVALSLLWTWYNPRIFPAPGSLDSWASRGVLGERAWLNRDTVPIPPYHRTIPNLLSAISGLGMLCTLWGVIVLDPWPTLFGAMVVYMGKLWFLDRMVWLWRDMQDATPEYTSWWRRPVPGSFEKESGG